MKAGMPNAGNTVMQTSEKGGSFQIMGRERKGRQHANIWGAFVRYRIQVPPSTCTIYLI